MEHFSLKQMGIRYAYFNYTYETYTYIEMYRNSYKSVLNCCIFNTHITMECDLAFE